MSVREELTTAIADIRDVRERIEKLSLDGYKFRESAEERQRTIFNRLDEIREALGTMQTAIMGSNQAVGIVTRLDRLEQTEARRIWNLRAIWVSVLAMGARMVADWVRR